MIVKMLCWWNKVLLFFLSRLFSFDNSFASNRSSQLLALAHSTCPATSLPISKRLLERRSAPATTNRGPGLQFLQRVSSSQIQDEFHPTNPTTQLNSTDPSSIVSSAPIPPTTTQIVDPTTGDIHFCFQWSQRVLAHATRHPSPPSSNISLQRDSCVCLPCS